MNANTRAILGLDEPPAREIVKNRRGVMSYSAKDTGSLQIFTNESWERNKHYYVTSLLEVGVVIKNFSKEYL